MNAHRALVRALTDGIDAAVLHSSETPWASITFEGARHAIRLRLAEAAAERLCRGLGQREFAIPGHLVADIAPAARERDGNAAVVEIEALTIALR